MTVYGYTEKQKDMILTAARNPGQWYEFTREHRSTARSLRRRGIVDMRPTEAGRFEVCIVAKRGIA